MDYDLFEGGNQTQNATQNSQYEIIITPYNILYGFLCSLGILADLAIVYVILKYSFMKTPTNLYILHWAVFNMLFLMHFIYFYAITPHFGIYDLYLSYELEAMLEIAIIIILILLIFDRCVEDDVTSQRLPIFVWLFLTMCLIVSHRWDVLHVFQIGTVIVYIFVVLVLVTKQILYLMRRNRVLHEENVKIRLTIVSVYMYFWALLWSCYYLLQSSEDSNILFAAMINTSLGLLSSVVNVFLLSYLDVHFRTAFMSLLKCKSASDVHVHVQSYAENDKDDSVEGRHRAVFMI